MALRKSARIFENMFVVGGDGRDLWVGRRELVVDWQRLGAAGSVLRVVARVFVGNETMFSEAARVFSEKECVLWGRKSVSRGKKSVFAGMKTMFSADETMFSAAKSLLRREKSLFVGNETMFSGADAGFL
jgi:hypothetical protein